MTRALIVLLLVNVLVVTVNCKLDYCQTDNDCIADNRFPNAKFCIDGCNSNDVESACFDGPVGDCCGCKKDGDLWKCAGCPLGQACLPNSDLCTVPPPTTLPPTAPAPATVKFKISGVTLSTGLESQIKTDLAEYLMIPEDALTNFRAVQDGNDVIVDVDILSSAGGMTPNDIADSIKTSFADDMSTLLMQAAADMSPLADVDTTFPVVKSIPAPELAVALSFPMTTIGDGTGGTITKADFESKLKSEIAVALGLDPDTITEVVATQVGADVRVDFIIESPSGTFTSTSQVVNQLTADIQNPDSTLIKNGANAGSIFQHVGQDGPDTSIVPAPTDVAFRLNNITIGDGTGGTITEADLKMKVLDDLVKGVPLNRDDIDNVIVFNDGDGVKVVVALPDEEATQLNDALVNENSKLNTDSRADPDSPLGSLDTSFTPVVTQPPPPQDITFRLKDKTGLTDIDIKTKLPEEIANGLNIDPNTIANVKVVPDGTTGGVFVTFTITEPSGTYQTTEAIAEKIRLELSTPNSGLLTGPSDGVLVKTDTDFKPTSPTAAPAGSGAARLTVLFSVFMAIFAFLLL